MMNKQEVIDEIENAIPDFILNSYQKGKESGLSYALELAKELDEPEKVVVPQFVADWYEKNKDIFERKLYQLCIGFHEQEFVNDFDIWFFNDDNKSIQTLVNMHQFGYEVEKEKLYTAKVKIAAECSYLNKNVERGDYFMSRQSESFRVKTHFPQSELEDLGLWNNPAFEIEEVEK